ncbi:AAA family ATPase [Niallia circulans]|uniref:AAA family ATPase n=1 Tax=Niallia circulans TaxID=1397 RepID=UPI0026F1B40B|nr:AAA family ATPase [Niallia circulans]
MENYTIRTSQKETVQSILKKEKGIEVSGLNNFKDHLEIGDRVFIVFGGDKVDWKKGFIAIGEISDTPYEFEARNFKIRMDVNFLLEEPLTKYDLRYYPDLFNVTFIGPMTKGEPNQAIQRFPIGKISIIIRAILDLDSAYEAELLNIFSEEEIEKSKERIEYLNTEFKTYDEKLNQSEPALIEPLEFIKGGTNIIIYGAPGTGKSYSIAKEYPRAERVVFHPEYTYHDFVGSYKPVPLYKKSNDIIQDPNSLYTVKGEPVIDYRFVPGPMLTILIKAFKEPHKFHTLIIEEMNRANTASVFGDLFQLLDRDSEGFSEYPIKISEDLRIYLYETGVLPNSRNNDLFIPPNLNLIATMNSTDQGVFVMDSAFKRRWNFKYYPINIEQAPHKDTLVPYNGHFIKWGELVKRINNLLSDNGVNEDKHIGPYFLKGDEPSNPEIIASKLLIYLWDDVVRHKRRALFINPRTFSELVINYKNGIPIFTFNIDDKFLEDENENL